MNSSSAATQAVPTRSRVPLRLALLACVVSSALFSGVRLADAHDTGVQHVHFKQPGRASQATAPRASARQVDALFDETQQGAVKQPAKPQRVAQARRAQPRTQPVSYRVRRDNAVRRTSEEVSEGSIVVDSQPHYSKRSVGSPVCDTCGIIGGCGCEIGCGIAEPTCGCGEPTCGICEPTCGCGDVACGGCVQPSGPDYWCFPVCLPRLKYMNLSLGVQGFRGPRDFIPAGTSDSNFGFNQAINVGGRLPLIGLVYPQLSYQLGYRAVQSRISGTLTDNDDRAQQFFTFGIFRRTNVGFQFGGAFDLLRDDLITEQDFHQVRTEFSIKSRKGREFGFTSATHTNTVTIGGLPLQSVDQYLLFYRWHFRNGGESRVWGGVSDDDEGIFGAEWHLPLSDRWSLQTGFNYLIPDQSPGPIAVSEEGWNVGINLVWHLRGMARKGCRSPFRPLFNIADNGTMFVDVQP